MKKAFTLVEMLIVVVVLVTLMSITFRLSSIGDTQKAKNLTISRMQRLENCLSGYYAAFGTYPPVKLHGSRDYNLKLNDCGIQDGGENEVTLNWFKETGDRGVSSENAQDELRQIKAACKAQPLAILCPFPSGWSEIVGAQSTSWQEKDLEDSSYTTAQKKMVEKGWRDVTQVQGQIDDEADWQDSQLYQFGLLSFLLPRYMIMMSCEKSFFNERQAQWEANNTYPANPFDGERYTDWTEVYDDANGNSNAKEGPAKIANIPSQAVCARWLPNLSESCYVQGIKNTVLYGVDIAMEDNDSATYFPEIHSTDKKGEGPYYVLACVTVKDGWGEDFYYYSPEPYQSYVLWSSGANKETFPPWVSREKLSNAKMKKCAGWLIEDDIVHLSH